MWEIIHYTKENGDSPVTEFLNKLDKPTKSKAAFLINSLRIGGNNLREPYTKFLRDGILELRIKSENSVRVLYFFQSGQKIVLTNGFIKKTQKAPDDEIERALKYKNDYIRRTK